MKSIGCTSQGMMWPKVLIFHFLRNNCLPCDGLGQTGHTSMHALSTFIPLPLLWEIVVGKSLCFAFLNSQISLLVTFQKQGSPQYLGALKMDSTHQKQAAERQKQLTASFPSTGLNPAHTLLLFLPQTMQTAHCVGLSCLKSIKDAFLPSFFVCLTQGLTVQPNLIWHSPGSLSRHQTHRRFSCISLRSARIAGVSHPPSSILSSFVAQPVWQL